MTCSGEACLCALSRALRLLLLLLLLLWLCAVVGAPFPPPALRHATLLARLVHACRSHMDFLSGMDTGSFLTCVQTITAQLDSLQADISAQAAFAMDHFATYYVRNAKKETEVMAALSAHLSSQPALFEMLMKVVFELVVFGDIGNQWSLARPLLSLILASETVRPGVSVLGYVCARAARARDPAPSLALLIPTVLALVLAHATLCRSPFAPSRSLRRFVCLCAGVHRHEERGRRAAGRLRQGAVRSRPPACLPASTPPASVTHPAAPSPSASIRMRMRLCVPVRAGWRRSSGA